MGDAGDEVGGGDDVVGFGGVVGVAYVVDAFQDDYVFDAGGLEDFVIEAREGVGTPAFVEDAVAADAHVDDAEVGGGGVGVEAVG